MTLLLFPVLVGAAACWGVAAHRHTVVVHDQAHYNTLKPPGHIWQRTLYRHGDQQRRARRTAVALTRILAGRVR